MSKKHENYEILWKNGGRVEADLSTNTTGTRVIFIKQYKRFPKMEKWVMFFSTLKKESPIGFRTMLFQRKKEDILPRNIKNHISC